ncbi:MAG: hypothetical protein J7K46_05630 [Bacteroidales bacterium]|nr:hypothetical protein [Bacteroidales bacterium]
MKVLFLGYKDSPLIEFIKSQGDECLICSDKIMPDYIKYNEIDFLVSYGYRHIIKKDVLELLKNRAINLHISYLPYNRGADPNFWSFIENTPKGVSIHLIDEGLDTGDILVQKEVHINNNTTLRTSYELLHREIQELFKLNWGKIKTNQIKPFRQQGKGTYHKTADKEKLLFIIKEKGYDTPVSKLIHYKNENR